jgi:hypothetical protein
MISQVLLKQNHIPSVVQQQKIINPKGRLTQNAIIWQVLLKIFCDHFIMFAFNLLSVTEKVLVQLNLTLVGKSDLYSDIYLRAVFRLNNNHYVLKALQRAGLLDLVQLSEPDCEESYHDMIREQKRIYSQRWVE